MKSTSKQRAVLAAATFLITVAAAQAQNAAGAAAARPAAAAGDELSEVVVTGSRVITNGDAMPTPVTVVTVEDVLRVQPTTISEALNSLPTFSGSRGQMSNPNTGTASQTGGGNSAGSFLNLRNMGAVRTLILFDGHRVPPTNVTGIVDTDMIPQQLLQRVEVVTGGASAVYGSDAVTGVVNFITDRRFNGIKTNVQFGRTQKGDDRSVNVGVAGGMDLFGGRGHLEGSVEYRNDGGVDSRSSRDPDHKVWSTQGAGTGANPYYLTPYARASNQSFGGLITNGVLNGQTFNTNGVLTPFVHGAASGTTNIEIGGDGVWFDTTLKTPARSHQVFGRFDLDITDSVHGYLEGAYNNKVNQVYTTWSLLNNVTIRSDNAFLPAAYRTQLTNANQTTFTFRKSMMDVPRNQTTATEKQLFFNGGLEGEFGQGYKWNVGLVHSSAKLTQEYNNINNGRLAASLDSTLSNGVAVCNVSITNPGLFPNCVPLNPFGPTSDSSDAVNYYRDRSSFAARTKMDDLSASLSGRMFDTWAGPTNGALSVEWRKVTYTGDSTAVPTDIQNCTGLRANCVSTGTALTTTWNSVTASRSEVYQTVKEAAFEFDLPLLKDKPLAKGLNLIGAARYTMYRTSGNYTTWKAGLTWELNDQMRFRGSRSRDIRAPTLDDLFAPFGDTLGNFTDPWTGNVVQNIHQYSGGNDKLTAEQGDTWTAGIVYKPAFLPNFSLAVDWFQIAVTNAILQLLPINQSWQNACTASAGTSIYCQLYVRPSYADKTAANNLTAVYTKQINIAEQDTNGVDFEFNYSTSLFSRPASARLLSTWQPNILYRQPTITTLNQGGAAFGTNGVTSAPVWRHTLFLRFSPIDRLTVDLQTRYRTSLKMSGDPTLYVATGLVPPATFTNMSLTYDLNRSWLKKGEVFLTVSNLFDKAPPPASFAGGQGIPGQQTAFAIYDDALGRAFMTGVRARF